MGCKTVKKLLSFFLTLALVLSLAACAAPKQSEPAQTEPEPAEPAALTFTDSAGRQVEVPAEITRVAPSGAVATMFLASVCPEYLVSVGSSPTEAQAKYLDARLCDLPETGQMYGSKGTLNLEQLLATEPQIIIDLGDKKKTVGEDMDALQEQTGVPTVFIEADLAHMAQAFRMLGSLLSGKEARCEELALYVEETLALAEQGAAAVRDDERVSVMYTSGASGLDTNAKGSSQAQVIELVGAVNAVEVENVSNKGGGNTVSPEQMYLFDPDVILFTSGSLYGQTDGDPVWQPLRAVQEGRTYEIPSLPYNWMSNPPSLNMLLGVRWLGNLLYPQYYDCDMVAETQRAYRLLWGCELSDAEVTELLSRSTLKN